MTLNVVPMAERGLTPTRATRLGSHSGTFALIHGGGGSAWDWHLVAPELRERGHDPVAADLPSEDGSAGGPSTRTRSSRRSATAATSSSRGTRSAASRRPSSV